MLEDIGTAEPAIFGRLTGWVASHFYPATSFVRSYPALLLWLHIKPFRDDLKSFIVNRFIENAERWIGKNSGKAFFITCKQTE
ncbi:hypothetical protein A4R26_16470 [Niastella populi]|uniref:Uncharacterized protein n=1 Tax=Niastella populi TaxID=550983 RepID=A0A1V9G2A8_9BACT|nr:hypothetical protein A4R26_16470 [Niastella populi]